MLSKIKKIGSVLRKRIHFHRRKGFLRILPEGSVGVELGVFKGEFTDLILRNVKPSKLYLVDLWWEGFGEFYPDWGVYTNYGKLKTKEAFQMANQRILKNDAMDICEIYVGDDLLFLESLENETLDWAYIDSSHSYEHTQKELILLDKKVKNKGVICGHDWREDSKHRHHGVYKAVNEYCVERGWKVLLLDRYTQWAIVRA
ncbi:MAG: class I SAM-dependent methyltransferase [Cyclobacteriaceae bacterium]